MRRCTARSGSVGTMVAFPRTSMPAHGNWWSATTTATRGSRLIGASEEPEPQDQIGALSAVVTTLLLRRATGVFGHRSEVLRSDSGSSSLSRRGSAADLRVG